MRAAGSRAGASRTSVVVAAGRACARGQMGWAGGNAARAGWVAWRAVVFRGQEAGRAVGQVRPHLAMAVFLGGRVSGNIGCSVIILADNYNLTTTANHKGTKAQRTLKKIRDGPPALRSVRAAGRRAGAATRLWFLPGSACVGACGQSLA